MDETKTSRAGKLLLALAIAGGLHGVPAAADLERFTPLGPPQGLLTSVVATPGGPWWAALSVSGLAVSTDRGESWSPAGFELADDPPRVLAVGRTPRELFAASATALYRSRDGGATWQLRGAIPAVETDLPTNDLLAFGSASATNDGTLYLARGTHLLISRDGGAHFAEVLTTPHVIQALAVNPARPARVFVGTVGSVIGDPTVPDTFFASSDAGAHWRSSKIDGNPTQSNTVDQLLWDASSGSLYALDGLRLFRSQDLGERWVQIVPRRGSSLPTEGFSLQIGLDPAAPGTLYLVHQKDDQIDLLVSKDLGARWTRVQSAASIANAGFVVVDGSRRLVAAGEGRLFDLDLRTGALRTLPLTSGPLAEVDAADPAAKVRFLPGDSDVIFVTARGALWTSRDRGASWSRNPELLFSFLDVSASTARPREVFAATDLGLARSLDGGRTFHLTSAQAVLLGELLQQPNDALLASGSGVFRSSANGAVLDQTLPDLPPGGRPGDDDRWIVSLVKDPRRPGEVYALALDGFGRHSRTYERPIFRSTDGGATWQQLAREGLAVAVDPHGAGASASPLYLWTDRTLERSLDGGDHWEILDTFAVPDSLDAPRDLQVDPRAAGLLWTAGLDGIRRSVDDGATFTPVPGGEGHRAYRLFPQEAIRGRIWAVTERGIEVGRFALP